METRHPRVSQRRVRLARWQGLPVAVVVGLLTSGCGSNFNAESQDPYQPGPGITDRSSDVFVINMLVVTSDEGMGTVVGSLVNQRSQSDYVVEFTASHSEAGELRTSPLPAVPADEASSGGDAPSAGVAVPASGATQLPKDAQLQVTGEAVVPGTLVTLTFTFHRGEPVTVEVPVFSEDNSYVGGPVGATTGDSSANSTEGTAGGEPTTGTPTSPEETAAEEAPSEGSPSSGG